MHISGGKFEYMQGKQYFISCSAYSSYFLLCIAFTLLCLQLSLCSAYSLKFALPTTFTLFCLQLSLCLVFSFQFVLHTAFTLFCLHLQVVGFHVPSPNAGEVTQGMKLGATKAGVDNLVGIHLTCAEVIYYKA